MVDVLSIKDNKVCAQVMKGMETAVRKFGVPIVGGHTHPDCDYNAIDVAIIGTARKGAGRSTATPPRQATTSSSPWTWTGSIPRRADLRLGHHLPQGADIVRRQMLIMNKIAAKVTGRSGKDISNPGTLGTLGMLLETSGKGAYGRRGQDPTARRAWTSTNG